MLSLESVKEYLRIDHSEDDLFLSSLILASEKYIKNATVSSADENTPIFQIAQRMLIGHWYENRGVVMVGKVTRKLEFALESLLMQITYAEGVEFGDVQVIDSGRFNGGEN